MHKDVADDPDLKFLEVHWWQPPGDKFHLGYSNNRLYQATRLNRRRQCVDHIDVISELSVLLCFEDLVSKKMKGPTLVNGKLGKKVIAQAEHLAKLTAKRCSDRSLNDVVGGTVLQQVCDVCSSFFCLYLPSCCVNVAWS